MEKLITLDNITKSYDEKCVLDHITLDLYKAQSIAFTGHNGCGKSTMLKLIAGLIRLSSGKIVHHKKIRFGFVPEKFPGMNIRMNDYLGSIAAMEEVDRSVVDGLVKDFFLESMINNKLNELSKGSLQKVGVIQALLGKHDVILLDEPLSGQDAASQDVFIEKINELRSHGVTILMSCHERRLIDELTDKEYSIHNGKLYCKESEEDYLYKIFVKKNDSLAAWPEMTDHGNKRMLQVKAAELKETVLRLYSEGWEITGIEEYL